MKRPDEIGLMLGPYRVLDLSDDKGSFCARLLGDLGAQVIKVEPPGGDPARKIGPFFHDIPDPQKSLHWFVFNMNKKGITLNLQSATGRELFRRLVKVSDFLVESFPPGYLDKLGLGYEDISSINPRIIMTSITPFGQTGPKAGYAGCDLTGWASGGAMYCCGFPDGPPMDLAVPQAYLHAGSEAAAGTLIAHHYRQASGEGQQVDVSIQESVMSCLMDTQEMWSIAKLDFRRAGNAFVSAQPGGGAIRQQYLLPCKDGWIVCYLRGGGNPANLNHMNGLLKWMDDERALPEWLKQMDWVNEYATNALTQEKVDSVEDVFIKFFRIKTKKEIYDQAVKRRLNIAPMCSPSDVLSSKQLEARAFWREIPYPELGQSITHCGPWAVFSETPLPFPRRAPLIGENNVEIYGGLLGLSAPDMLSLMESAVI